MHRLLSLIPFVLGSLLLLYVFTLGEIWNNHATEHYLLLAAGLICIALGCVAAAAGRSRRESPSHRPD